MFPENPQQPSGHMAGMSASTGKEDAHRVMARLAEACERHGLGAVLVAPTRVRVSPPGAVHPEMTEIITLGADEADRLFFYWSWNEKICPADDSEWAAQAIQHVLVPQTDSSP